MTRLSLPDQAEKLGRILDDRVKFYRLGAKKGTLALDEASAKHSEVEDIRRSFAWFVANATWIKAEAMRRAIRAEQDAELAAIEREPAVAAILDTFPGAAVARVSQPAEDALT